MKSPTDFATHLTAFLTNYLPLQRSVSPHTIKAYRDAFRLFLRFCRDERGLAPEQLHLTQIDAPLVLAFLEHTEQARHCTARTRNHRLAALHAFFRYVQSEEPAFILACQRILAIPFQRHESRVVGYLSAKDLAVIFGPLQSLEQKVGLSNRGPPNSTYNLAFTLTFGATQRITPLILLY